MRKGDKLICINEITNIMNMPLFEKGKTYEVLYVDNEDVEVMVCLNHILYANEYNNFSVGWVNKNFKYGGR
jgi:uncharacterized protein YlbG (UPF0298 family)